MGVEAGARVRVRVEVAQPVQIATTIAAVVLRVSEKAAYVKFRTPDGQLLHRWVPLSSVTEVPNA